jgi:hypothetical protein
MKPVHAVKDISDKNYRALEEYLDLLIRAFDIAEDAGLLPQEYAQLIDLSGVTTVVYGIVSST